MRKAANLARSFGEDRQGVPSLFTYGPSLSHRRPMTTCTVCGTDIDAETPSADAGYGSESYPEAQTEYHGSLYYFCSSEHKREFEADPEQFV
jgi:YHS domain-containing protein